MSINDIIKITYPNLPEPPPPRIYKECFGILVLQNKKEILDWDNKNGNNRYY